MLSRTEAYRLIIAVYMYAYEPALNLTLQAIRPYASIGVWLQHSNNSQMYKPEKRQHKDGTMIIGVSIPNLL